MLFFNSFQELILAHDFRGTQKRWIVNPDGEKGPYCFLSCTSKKVNVNVMSYVNDLS